MTELNAQMSVAEIVFAHSETVPVFQRHRIDYCCQGKLPLTQACERRGVDPTGVLKELEQAVAQRATPKEVNPLELSTSELVQHVVERHHRYLREALPVAVQLARKVARVHGEHNPKLLPLRDAVEALSDSLLPHLDNEEAVLFPALTSEQPPRELIRSELDSMYADHLDVAELLETIRASADDFSVPEWGCTSYRTLFRELEALEEDTHRHVNLENHALMPRFVSEAA